MNRYSLRPDQDNWSWFLLGVLTVSQFFISIRTYLDRSLTAVSEDVLMYSHYGWYITEGAIPYVHYWDPKAPLTHEFSASLALLSGGDMFILYILGIIATGTAAVLTGYFAGQLVYTTGGWRGGLFAGLGVYTFVGFHQIAAVGYRPKPFTALLGILGLYLILIDKPFFGGLVSACSAAFWQPGVIFPLLVVGIAAVNYGRRALIRTLSGVVTAIIIVVGPFLIWWDFEAVIGAAVFAPLVSSGQVTLLSVLVSAFKLVNFLKYSTVFLVVGIVGALRLAYHDLQTNWWLGAGTIWFGFQILFLDFDGYADLLLAFPFFVVAAGYYYEHLSINYQRIFQLTVVVLFLISVLVSGGVGIGFSPMNDSQSVTVLDEPLYNAAVFSFAEAAGMSPRNNEAIDQARASGADNLNGSTFAGALPPAHEIYWEKKPPSQCLYWVNKQSVSYFRTTNTSPTQPRCTYDIF